MSTGNNGWIGVDLDGTLAHYVKWTAIDHVGEPIWPMVERVKNWLREGRKVKILTARVSDQSIRINGGDFDVTLAHVVRAIKAWCEEHIGERLEVTCSKDLDMIELWDDRAVQVEPNVGEPTTYWQSRVS